MLRNGEKISNRTKHGKKDHINITNRKSQIIALGLERDYLGFCLQENTNVITD